LTPPGLGRILSAVLGNLRRIAAIALAIGLLTGAWRPCAGWQATAEARMSCCLRKAACAKHKAAEDVPAAAVGQAEADRCCAASERPDAYQPPSAVIAPPIVMPLAGLFAEGPGVPILSIVWHRPPPLRASRQLPTHLLLSVFLI